MEKPKTARGNPYAIGENPYLCIKLTKKIRIIRLNPLFRKFV